MGMRIVTNHPIYTPTSFTRDIRYTTDVNSCHGRGFCSSSSLVAKCIPVFVKVRSSIVQLRVPHTTMINLSSIVVWDFLPPLVMTSLLEQAPDWLTRREYPPKFRLFNLHESRVKRPKRSIRATSFNILIHKCIKSRIYEKMKSNLYECNCSDTLYD